MERQYLTRRKFFELSAIAAGGSVLAACAPTVKVVKETVEVAKAQTVVVEKTVAVTAVPPTPAPAKPVTLNVWMPTNLETQEVVKVFQGQFPNIKIELSEIGEIVFGGEKYLIAVAAGKGPDVAYQNRNTFLQFAAKGLYLDVTPRFEADGLKRTDYYKTIINETTWQGKLLGLPTSTGARFLFWNKAHFQEAELDPETPPKTWDDLGAYTEKLSKKDAQGRFQRIGFVPYGVGNGGFWNFCFATKAPAISADMKTILCDDPRWIGALEWMVGFFDKYLGSLDTVNTFSQGIAELGDPFVSQRVSMIGHTSNGEGTVLARAPAINWGVAPMAIPPNGEKACWCCGFSLVMPPTAKQPDPSWQFMKWYTGVEGWKAIAEWNKAETARIWAKEKIQGNPVYFPVNACHIPSEQLLDKYAAEVPGKGFADLRSLSKDALANWAHGCGSEMGLAALEYFNGVDSAVKAALAHKMTPSEALKDCKKKAQEATDRAWSALKS